MVLWIYNNIRLENPIDVIMYTIFFPFPFVFPLCWIYVRIIIACSMFCLSMFSTLGFDETVSYHKMKIFIDIRGFHKTIP